MKYLEIKEFTLPSRQLGSVNISPVQPAEQQEPVKQPPDNTNDTIKNSDKDSTINAAPDILATPLGLGMTNGYFSSLADGRTLREDIRGYYFDILEKINKRWWQKAGTLAEVAQQDSIIEILIGRDGKLIDVRQMRSTGSREVDRALIDAITEVAPFPPLPDSYEPQMFQAPLKISKPSHLFGVRNAH